MSKKKLSVEDCFPGKGEYDFEIFGIKESRAITLATELFAILESNIIKNIAANKEYTISDGMKELYEVEDGLTITEYGWVCFCVSKVMKLVKTKVAEDKANSIIKSNQERLDRDIMKGNHFNRRIRGHE